VDELDALLAALAPEERGLVAGLQLLGAAPGALSALIEGKPSEGSLTALQAVPRHRRAELLAILMKEIATPLPAGLGELDPSWVEALMADQLADERPELVRAVLVSLPVAFRLAGEAGLRRRPAEPSTLDLDPEALADLQRILLAPLVALAVGRPGPQGARLAAQPSDELLAEVARVGARTLGQSLAGAPLALRAQVMAGVGSAWSAEIATAAAAPIGDPEREQARALVRAATRVAQAPSPDRRLQTVGVLALAAPLAAEGPVSLARVAGRLPFDLGRLLLDRWNGAG
jgi:hypothetical protein